MQLSALITKLELPRTIQIGCFVLCLCLFVEWRGSGVGRDTARQNWRDGHPVSCFCRAQTKQTNLSASPCSNAMNSPRCKQSAAKVCVKCILCGLPWNKKLQRKRKYQRKKLGSSSLQTTTTVVHFQFCSIIIQSYVRRYLIQRHRKKNDPIEQWNRRCVHYLLTKGPYYGARSHFDAHRRVAVYCAAAVDIQKKWRLHRWLKHLQQLSSAVKEFNAKMIQRIWRSSWCRRSFGIVCRAVKCQERLFYSVVTGSNAGSDIISFCLSVGCPFAIKYKQQSRNSWMEVDCNKFRSYISQQLQVEEERKRRISNRLRTTNIKPTPTKSAAELKHEKIRKMSQRKWKWFYDKRDCGDKNDSIAQPKIEVDNASHDADDEVMVWLTNLDLDNWS